MLVIIRQVARRVLTSSLLAVEEKNRNCESR